MKKLLIIFMLAYSTLFSVENEIESTILGPLKIKGKKPDSKFKKIKFCVSNLQDTFTLEILNGKINGQNRLNSLEISLNGQTIVTSNDVNNGIPQFSKEITVQKINTIKIKSIGSKRSFAFLTIKSTPLMGNVVFGPVIQTAKKKKKRKINTKTYNFSISNPNAEFVIRIVNGDPEEDGDHGDDHDDHGDDHDDNKDKGKDKNKHKHKHKDKDDDHDDHGGDHGDDHGDNHGDNHDDNKDKGKDKNKNKHKHKHKDPVKNKLVYLNLKIYF